MLNFLSDQTQHSVRRRVLLVLASVFAALLLMTLSSLAPFTAQAPVQAQAQARTANPYTYPYGSPDCTWFSWQRLHDTEGIDLQLSANAGDWITRAEQSQSAWDEHTQKYVAAQINLIPAAGDVIVLPYPSAYAHPYHVAFVENVYANGTFLVSEQSYGDYSPGPNTQPYPYVRHTTWSLRSVQQAEQNQARFLHFAVAQPPVSSDNAKLVSQTAHPTVQTGQQFGIAFTVQNVGTTTWGSGYALMCLQTCLSGANVPVSGSVAPGAQDQFPATLTAPPTAGSYTTNWQMATPSGSGFGPVFSLALTVQGDGNGAPTATPSGIPLTDNSAWVSQSAYPSVQSQQQFQVSFTFQNTGTTTWADGAYALACDTYYHADSNCMSGNPVGFGGQSVAPGQQFTFTVSLTAPSSPGSYVTYWDLTHTGGIFGNNNVYLVVTVQTPQPQWNSWYQQHRPACDDSSAWQDANHAATRDCSSSNGLVLSQYSNTSWAELDLDSPNGGTNYNQTLFRTSVQTGFLNPGDTSVWAGLLVQTPQGGTSCGGVILAVNSTGRWQLQQVASNCQLSTQSGQIGIDPGNFTMQIIVQNGQLSAAINGQTVTSGINDSANPSPGAIGLLEESSHATSSAILYSNFDIDQWS